MDKKNTIKNEYDPSSSNKRKLSSLSLVKLTNSVSPKIKKVVEKQQQQPITQIRPISKAIKPKLVKIEAKKDFFTLQNVKLCNPQQTGQPVSIDNQIQTIKQPASQIQPIQDPDDNDSDIELKMSNKNLQDLEVIDSVDSALSAVSSTSSPTPERESFSPFEALLQVASRQNSNEMRKLSDQSQKVVISSATTKTTKLTKYDKIDKISTKMCCQKTTKQEPISRESSSMSTTASTSSRSIRPLSRNDYFHKCYLCDDYLAQQSNPPMKTLIQNRPFIRSTSSGKIYKIEQNLNCSNYGVFCMECKYPGCREQFLGKTTKNSGTFLNFRSAIVWGLWRENFFFNFFFHFFFNLSTFNICTNTCRIK